MAGLYEFFGIIFLLMLFLSVLIQIVMRNIFNSGSIQLEELARFSLVSLVFLMIPVLTWKKTNKSSLISWYYTCRKT